MADETYTTRMRITSDVSGAVAAGKEYDKLIAKAKDLGKESAAQAKKSKAAFGDLSKAVGALRKVMSGFGTVALFGGLIAGIAKIRDSFKSAQKQAEAMAKIQKELGESKAIQGLATQYNQLADSIAAAAKAQTTRLDQIDEDVAGRRRLDKANLEAEKQKELEALNPNAEDYAERKAQIEARYAAREANMNASNAREDIVLKRQRLGVEADIKDQEANAEDKNAETIRAQIAQAQRRMGAAQVGAVDLNEADKKGGFDTIGKTFAQIFTGQWGRAAGATTAEGDAIRQQKAKEAADAELKVAELQEQLRKSEERARALRNEAGAIRSRQEGMGQLLDAADVEADTARRQGDMGITAADAAYQKKQDAYNKEVADTADAVEAKRLLEQKKAEFESQIAAQKQRVADAGARVYAAQGAQSEAAANGDRRGAAAAGQQVASAQAAAQEVEYGANRLIASLTEKLQQVNALLSKANSAIAKNNQQRLTQQAEAVTAP